MLVVEVFRTIDTLSLEPLSLLETGQKVIYVTQRDNVVTEREIKVIVKDIATTLIALRKISKYVRSLYIRDVIFGVSGEKKKIRLRIQDNFEYSSINATHKYHVAIEDNINKEIEETVYSGPSIDDAQKMIKLQGDFQEENSYEKTRTLFKDEHDTEITLDIYPFGTVLEIEGEVGHIKSVASKLGYSAKDYIHKTADDLYLEWVNAHSAVEQWDVRFGFTGKK